MSHMRSCTFRSWYTDALPIGRGLQISDHNEVPVSSPPPVRQRNSRAQTRIQKPHRARRSSLLDGEAEQLLRKAIELVRVGNVVMLKFLLGRTAASNSSRSNSHSWILLTTSRAPGSSRANAAAPFGIALLTRIFGGFFATTKFSGDGIYYNENGNAGPIFMH